MSGANRLAYVLCRQVVNRDPLPNLTKRDPVREHVKGLRCLAGECAGTILQLCIPAQPRRIPTHMRDELSLQDPLLILANSSHL